MAERISEKIRRQVVEEVSAGKRRSTVARKHGISQASVTLILRKAKILPLPLTKERAASVTAAVEAIKLDARRRRAELSLRCIEDAERIRLQLWEPFKVYDFGGRDFGYVEKQLAEPDARSKRDLMIAMGILVDKSIQLDKANAEVDNAPRAAIIELFDRMAAEESKTHITIEE